MHELCNEYGTTIYMVSQKYPDNCCEIMCWHICYTQHSNNWAWTCTSFLFYTVQYVIY